MAMPPPSFVCTSSLLVPGQHPRRIASIRFGLLSSEEVQRMAQFHAFERSLYQLPQRRPQDNGILDLRLGTTDKKGECQTCFGKLADCGGYVRLELPVFHVGYFKNIVALLQCICKACARVMVPEDERRDFLRRLRNPNTELNTRRALFKRLQERCKRFKGCPFCAAPQGIVKRVGSSLKVLHEKYAKNPDVLEAFVAEFDEAAKHNDALRPNLSKVAEDLNPIRVLGLFERISQEDCDLLDIRDRPEALIVTHLVVPPVCIRPSVEMDGSAGTNEDDLTMKLSQIVEVNNVLRMGLDKGLAVNNLMENWDFLQLQCALYINSELPGVPQAFQTPGKPLRGFVQRLKGKQGRFRGNLSGKRVDFSGRTVISPDPNLRIDEVGVPVHIATTLTFPERVCKHNIEKLRKRVRNGLGVHPGANFVLFNSGGKQFLKYGDRKRVAAELKYGDVVERHLEDGDVVLFNRQPSLHKMSIMAHRARIMPWRTLRFNECVCTPYNADFDGDEMNIHVPQTEEARAEAIQLMGVHHNLCTPKNGEILIAATQDFLTSAYLLTSKDFFLDRSHFALLCAFMGDALEHVDLPPPTILRPMELWTGKQLFSVLVRPSRKCAVFVNLELEEKAYTKRGQHFCTNEGYVCFRNSELLSGRLGKVTLGSGNKAGLFYVLSSDYSPAIASTAMNRLAKLSARWIGTRGFSIGIADVTPDHRLIAEKEGQVHEGYEECERLIALYKDGRLQLLPGCTPEQTLESSVLGVLSRVREAAGNVCLQRLPRHNSPLIMALCGSKGSTINICQMVACVGQQAVSGARIQDGFFDRTLPHFRRGERTPDAKGFVSNSFFSGLSPTEFFFHTMGGREGLVDTAVKTAETGYMSRRLMKALEDLSVQYDNTVRNSTGGIVQLVYGDDGLDPVSMEGKDSFPIDFHRLLMRTFAEIPRRAADAAVDGHAVDTASLIRAAAVRHTSSSRGLDGPSIVTDRFKERLGEFVRVELWKTHDSGAQGLTAAQLHGFIDQAVLRYLRKRTEPGTAVGAIGAQSIGEPGTQMTLKTFHFAGVASMNVTLGVPRIKEIINAAKSISTPIITCVLLCDTDVKAARIVKNRLEKTVLGQIVSEISQKLRPGRCFVKVKLNTTTIESLRLSVDARTVASAILGTPKLKLRQSDIRVVGPSVIHVTPPEGDRVKQAFSLQALAAALQRVIVQGIPSVERAVINDLGGGKYNLLVEGTNLQAVMGTEGVNGGDTTTNHVMETERTLGIEAARNRIVHEIKATMQAHGMSIDVRHSMLLADVMTYKGEVLGITRFGMARMKDSVLMLASFEKTTDHLFDAAIHGRRDDIVGVSESIIMGAVCPLGTGLFKLRMDAGKQQLELPRRLPLLLTNR